MCWCSSSFSFLIFIHTNELVNPGLMSYYLAINSDAPPLMLRGSTRSLSWQTSFRKLQRTRQLQGTMGLTSWRKILNTSTFMASICFLPSGNSRLSHIGSWVMSHHESYLRSFRSLNINWIRIKLVTVDDLNRNKFLTGNCAPCRSHRECPKQLQRWMTSPASQMPRLWMNGLEWQK